MTDAFGRCLPTVGDCGFGIFGNAGGGTPLHSKAFPPISNHAMIPPPPRSGSLRQRTARRHRPMSILDGYAVTLEKLAQHRLLQHHVFVRSTRPRDNGDKLRSIWKRDFTFIFVTWLRLTNKKGSGTITDDSAFTFIHHQHISE